MLLRRSTLLFFYCLYLCCRFDLSFAFCTRGRPASFHHTLGANFDGGQRIFDLPKLREGTRPPLEQKLLTPLPLVKSDPAEKAGQFQPSPGIFLAVSIILALAIKGDDDILSDSFAMDAVTNIFDASLPSSSTDIVAGSLGEAIAGTVGALCTVVVTFLLQSGMTPAEERATRVGTKPLVTQAISDSDYFVASSASLPLLQAVGVPPFLASVGSVVLAAIPSQLVKLGGSQKERRLEENRMMQELLAEQQARELQLQRRPLFMNRGIGYSSILPTTVNPNHLISVTEAKIDFVDVFSDVTRWLGYNVLKSDFGGQLAWDGELLGLSESGAILGFMAAVSAQLYSDVIYGWFRYGPEAKQEEVFSRSSTDWASVYFSRAVSAATLFGVYEGTQRPISRFIQGTLSGGMEGCVGSESFNLCLQTYIDANSPGASPGAQLRALITNLVMVDQRLQDIAIDTSTEDVKALVRGWAVSCYSYLSHL